MAARRLRARLPGWLLVGLAASALALAGCGSSTADDANRSPARASASSTPSIAVTAVASSTPPTTAPATTPPPTSAPPAGTPADTAQPDTGAADTGAANTPADGSPACDGGSGWSCDWQARFQAADAYADSRPGTVGIVVTDRQTGAVWANQYADTQVYTASTIKLAMVVDLLQRNDSGAITLTDDDRSLMEAMLHSSDDDAADTLWYRYSGPGDQTFNDDFAALGMTGLTPVLGPDDDYAPYWGFQTCTPQDLSTLINYVLNTLNPADRDWIVPQMQAVDEDQQWGVWAAGPAAMPGNKDGWSDEVTGSIMNSVGFVGPGQRYTIAIMNSLNGQGDEDDGRVTVSQVAQTIFGGVF
jgi:hypothetical protein